MRFHQLIALVYFYVSFPICSSQYFYIYEWPNNLQDVYPPPGAQLDGNAAYSHDFYDNGGAGKMVDGDSGMFVTWQFSLFKNLMSRLRVSEYRTRDPTKASAFIVPYDAGVHSFIDHETGKSRLASPFGWQAIELLTKARKKEPDVFWKKNGHDHFVIFSVTGYQMVGIGTKQFFMNICQNCTVLTIETTPSSLPIPGRTKKLWYAVPYPSSYHWWEGIRDRPWRVNRNPNSRNILAIFIGSVRTMNANANALRRKLFEQCGNAASRSECQWYTTAHADTGVVNQSQALQLYRRSKYCLAPPGDSLTRKSLFDSYMSGCVPVLFAKATLLQYSWHLSPEDIKESTVLIPRADIISGSTNIVDVLQSITDAELLAMQERIAKLAFRLQYSVVPEQFRKGTSTVSGSSSGVSGDGIPLTGESSVWSPPDEDAADVIISRILNPDTIEPIRGFSDEQLKSLQVEQKHIMETNADYMGMTPPGGVGGGGKKGKGSKGKGKGKGRGGKRNRSGRGWDEDTFAEK